MIVYNKVVSNRISSQITKQCIDSTDGYKIDGGSRLENISDLFDRILAPYKVKRKIDSTIR